MSYPLYSNYGKLQGQLYDQSVDAFNLVFVSNLIFPVDLNYKQ